jgi:hypothetical protein
MRTTKIQVTHGCLIAGVHAEPGAVHELPTADAVTIIGTGRAVRYVETAALDGAIETAATAPATETAAAPPPLLADQPAAAAKASRRKRA